MEEFNFKFENKETPLDVLLELIKKNKMDIYDIPIADLTDQFMEYINKMQEHDMESVSEFVVTAAELVKIKTKMLLPKSIFEDEEDDPRQDLANRLIEYKYFKNAAEEFAKLNKNSGDIFFRETDIYTLNELKTSPEEDIPYILEGITMRSLYNIFADLLKRCEEKPLKEKRKVKFNKINYTIEDRIEHIKNLLIINGKILFKDIFNNNSSKMEIIVTFSAMLELIKMKEIAAVQEDLFSDIYIYSAQGGEQVALD